MQTIIYEFADNSFHIREIKSGDGNGLRLVFPKITNGECRLGNTIVALKGGCACFEETRWRRGAYPVELTCEHTTFPADALTFGEGVWSSESGMHLTQAFLEIARLKDACRELCVEIEKLKEAVFRTAIF